jgi:lambda family phage tail tape measure protein
MAIWNMLARLTMDSTAFDRNAGKARKSMRELSEESNRTGKRLLDLVGTGAKLAGIGGGLYAAKRIFADITGKAMAQQEAVRKLAAAYSLTNDATAENVSASEAFAASLQKRTTLADELILSEMAFGKTLGITTDRLGDATVAAIGLTSHGMELHEAMKIMALAFKGETGQLKERGILVDANLSAEEKFNELVRQGAEKFKLAEDATRGAAGAQTQFKNTLGDTEEVIGQTFLPTLQNAFTAIHDWLQDNQADIKAWAEGSVAALGWVAKIFLKVQDQIVGDRADQWIRHTAQERLSQEEAAKPPWMETAREEYRQTTGDAAAWQREVQETGLEGERSPQYIRKWHEILQNYQQARADRLSQIEAQLRQENEDLLTSSPKPRTLPGVYDMPSLDVTSSPQFPGTDGGSEAAATQQSTSDIAAAMSRMYDQIDSRSEASFTARYALILQQRRQYEEMGIDANAIDEWYTAMHEKHEIARQKATGNFFDGWRAGFAEMKRDLPTLGELGADAATTFRDGMVDATTDILMNVTNVRDAFRELGKDMARWAIRSSLNQLYTTGFSAVSNWIGGGTAASAKGNAFDRSGIVPFASGGIVDAPTVFRFAQGTGVMGEAGPEAILPLSRDSSTGKLGVTGSSPRVSIQVVNNGTAKNARSTEPQWNGREWVIGVILEDYDKGGKTRSLIRGRR